MNKQANDPQPNKQMKRPVRKDYESGWDYEDALDCHIDHLEAKEARVIEFVEGKEMSGKFINAEEVLTKLKGE